MLKLCLYCHVEKDIDEDFPESDWPKCWDCAFTASLERPASPYLKGARTKENYVRITKQGIVREKLEKEQKSRCAICDTHSIVQGKNLSLDHDHETGQIRGLLCNKCNLLIGMADDNPALLRAAASYLEKCEPRSENEQVCDPAFVSP